MTQTTPSGPRAVPGQCCSNPRDPAARYLLIVNIVVIAVLSAGIGYEVLGDRARVIADATVDAENLRDALAEHSRQTFSALDVALAVIAEEIQESSLHGEEAHHSLRARHFGMPGAQGLFTIDADGLLATSSDSLRPTSTDLSGRALYQAHQDDRSTALRIAPPRKGAADLNDGRWVIDVSRTLLDRNGFAGVAVASLSVDYLVTFYEALQVGRDGAVGLFRDDGLLLARSPFREEFVGRDFAETRLFDELLPKADGGVYKATYVSDGVERVTAYKRVPGLPLVVYVGISVDERLAGWHRRSVINIGMGVLAAALVVGLSLLFLRRLNERRRESDARIARLADLTDLSAELIASPTVAAALDKATGAARRLVPAHQAVTSLTDDPSMAQAIHAVSLSDKYAAWRDYEERPDGSGIYRLVCEQGRPMRMTQAELESHPAWRGFGDAHDRHPPMRGWLAAPLTQDDGTHLGLIQLTDRETGEFTAEDEALLLELAHVASAALHRLEYAESLQAALRQADAARAEIETVFSSISDGVVVLDTQWRITYVNDRAIALMERPRTALVGVNLWTEFPELADTDLFDAFGRARRDRSDTELEVHDTARGRWLGIRAFPHDCGLTVYIRNISVARLREEQLRHAQKLEAVGQLTGGVAHDFNNLLTVILGNAEILVEELAEDPNRRALAEITAQAASRGAELTARLLAFARQQPLDPKPIDANRLVAGMDGLLRRSLGEHIEIELVRAAGLWSAMADPGQLESAVLNLCINARDAMRSGGRLTIETANVHLDADYAARETEVEPGQYVMVAVSDTGVGMDAQTMKRAFDPFFTTKEVGEGSGLGLSMVYGFAKQSHGHVRLYSERGHGTTVRLYLPRAAAAPDQAETARAEIVEQGFGRILLVEDDGLVRGHVASQLRGLGYEVVEAGDGPAAMAILRDDSGFDLLFTDVVMPGGMSGRELADKAASLRPGLPILFTSGYTENAIVHHGRLDRGVHLLQKPYHRHDLARAVKRALEGRTKRS